MRYNTTLWVVLILGSASEWAKYFVLAGKKVAALADAASQNIVVGFSLPTRSYAVLFFFLAMKHGM